MDLPSSTRPDPEIPDLAGMTPDELEYFMTGLGKEKYRAGQVMQWIHQGLLESFEGMTNLSKLLRQELADMARIESLSVLKTAHSEDGTVKFLFGLRDGNAVETVLIPEEGHDTLCVSTQVGCGMGCRMCRTAGLGLVRNLTSGEIVGQLLAVRRTMPAARVTNVVFMGMGEPLANYHETVKALKILSHPNGPGVSWRRTTVSTCGLVPRIGSLGRDARAKLAVSLNAVTDEQRDEIMPVNRSYPISELVAALREYPLSRGDRITIEYVLMKGLNDSDADARQLVRLLNRLKYKVNLIRLNGDTINGLEPSTEERVLRFQEVLMSRSVTTMVRKSKGRDILAACGQLAAGRTEDS